VRVVATEPLLPASGGKMAKRLTLRLLLLRMQRMLQALRAKLRLVMLRIWCLLRDFNRILVSEGVTA
jgi:hypothetical protein